MMEQVRLCAVWPVDKLTWLFLEPDTRLDHCLRILLVCFRARTSALRIYLTSHKKIHERSATAAAAAASSPRWVKITIFDLDLQDHYR